ncbi:MAG TPA: hypothetical protein VFG30_18630 [Polyangiales bacterium]|nr:hypothetical protein [Polyangiales bacterium]
MFDLRREYSARLGGASSTRAFNSVVVFAQALPDQSAARIHDPTIEPLTQPKSYMITVPSFRNAKLDGFGSA